MMFNNPHETDVPRIGSRRRSRIGLLAAFAAAMVGCGVAAAGADESAFGGKRVAAYWADWEYYYDNSFTHDRVDFSKVTHVNYAFAWNDEEGTIYFTDRHVFDGLGNQSFSGGAGNGPVKCSPPFWHPYSSYDNRAHAPVCQSWNDHNSGFVKSVHDGGAKAILSVGGWTLSDRVSEMLESPTARTNFVDNAVQILTDWSLDGLDLDFEFPGYAPHGGRPIDKANYILLLQELRERFDSIEAMTGRRLELTAAVSCGPQIANDAYDYDYLADLLDYVNIMAYDFGGDWDPVAQHNSPLYPYDGQMNAGFDADSCREFWMTTGQVPADKIVLGMAHYGRSFRGATAIGESSAGHDSTHWVGDTETRYYQIVAKEASDPTFHTAYDPVAGTHYGWFDGGGFISFEDTTSIAQRAGYVVDQGLAGVMIWQLHGGMIPQGAGYDYPLLDATIAVFQGDAPPEQGSGDDDTEQPDDEHDDVDDGTGGDGNDEGGTDGEDDGGDNGGEDDDTGGSGSTDACPEFVQPYAGDPAHQVGDKVSFNGTAYVSTFAPNWWSPAAAPQYWQQTTCEVSGEDEADPGEEAEEDPPSGGACTPFVQPYAGDAAYQAGDRVVFNGRGYVSTFAPNWWSPALAPQYWADTSCD